MRRASFRFTWCSQSVCSDPCLSEMKCNVFVLHGEGGNGMISAQSFDSVVFWPLMDNRVEYLPNHLYKNDIFH